MTATVLPLATEGRPEPPPAGPGPGDGLTYHGGGRGRRLLPLADLWRSRDLIWMLVARDLTVRYRQTVVGVGWAVAQPVAQAAVFVALFGLLGREPTAGGVPYPLVVLTGLLPWQLAAGVVTQSAGSLVANQQLIGKVYFPRLVLPMAASVPPVVDLAFALVVPAGLMLYYGVAPTPALVALPVVIGLAVLTGLAAGIGLAAVNALYRDAGYTLPFVLQVGFFVSPVVYATDALIPEGWRGVYALNPAVGVIDGFRWAVLGGDPPVGRLAQAAAVDAVVLTAGLVYFRRVEGFLADRI